MTILVAYRRRGSPVWTHHFRVTDDQWRGFRRHARMWRQYGEYARVVHGEYVSII